jgi:hypothetical protein
MVARAFHLKVVGAAADPRVHGFEARAVGPDDEVLCGYCRALLGIDHRARYAGVGDSPGEPDGIITCAICGHRNFASQGSVVPPARSPHP